MMRQYREVKQGLPPGTILLFRLGDFYEMFEEDAEAGARALGITLTKRHEQPMAGIPYHAAETYIGKLLQAGWKVAICDQVETPKPGKLVQRALTRILTPGTLLETNQIDPQRNHYIVAVNQIGGETTNQKLWAVAWMDLTSGEFKILEDGEEDRVLARLSALDPREIVLPENMSLDGDFERLVGNGLSKATLPEFHFDREDGRQALMDAYAVLSLEGFGVPRNHAGTGPAGALLHYAREMLRHPPENLRPIRVDRPGDALIIDPATQRNLEVFRTGGGRREGSLMHAVDRCVTPAGSRKLEEWLASPPLDAERTRGRHRIIRALVEVPSRTAKLRDHLARSRDLQRILARLQNRIRNPRELGGIRETLAELPAIRQVLDEFDQPEMEKLGERVTTFPKLSKRLEEALADELPGKLDEGGLIRDGYLEELDHFRGLARDSKTWIAELERAERERSGIKNLRIKYNNAFGYFIEVTKANLHLVPEEYVRRQTMTNAERFVTSDLKMREKEILHAEEKAIALEEECFRQLIAEVLEEAERLFLTAEALAELDLLSGWSHLAREWDYAEPEIIEAQVLEIDQGRHPVVEQQLRLETHGLAGAHAFVPNDCSLSGEERQIALITGPNMAGKSTFIRQVALIALLAQCGCWVPARSCRMGLVDRIFSRVGASDELARGNSTFMVEMNETANILHHATPRSVVILDEIGRGTSTYDGLSIAWAVIEHLHGSGRDGPLTLFATHYHELTRLSGELPRLNNYCVSVKEWNDRIVFVRQVIPGAADRSYGIQVARLAGLPESVIERARDLLYGLESGTEAPAGRPEMQQPSGKKRHHSGRPRPVQLELF